jgi:hypothetical protein
MDRRFLSLGSSSSTKTSSVFFHFECVDWISKLKLKGISLIPNDDIKGEDCNLLLYDRRIFFFTPFSFPLFDHHPMDFKISNFIPVTQIASSSSSISAQQNSSQTPLTNNLAAHPNHHHDALADNSKLTYLYRSFCSSFGFHGGKNNHNSSNNVHRVTCSSSGRLSRRCDLLDGHFLHCHAANFAFCH